MSGKKESLTSESIILPEDRVPLDAGDGPKTIRVRAFRTGEYGLILRQPGDVFDLHTREIESQKWLGDDRDGPIETTVLTAREQFSKNWMREVPPETPLKRTSAQQAVDRDVEQLIVAAS